MKQKIFFMAAVSVACLITSTTQSFALSIGGCLGRVCESGGTVVAQGTNCSSSSRTCYDDQAVISCSACNSGYTRTAKTVTVDMCDDPVTYYTCTSGGSVGQACGRKSCGVGANIVRRGLNCLSYASETCLDSPSGDQGVQSCATCQSVYETQTSTVSITGCTNTLTFTTCVKTCNGTCTNCSDTDWTAAGTGYERRIEATCNTLTCICTKKTQYRCANNYYGSPSNNITGCTKCPDSGYSVAGMNADITRCYITGGSDASGTFVFDHGQGSSYIDNNRCYYSN